VSAGRWARGSVVPVLLLASAGCVADGPPRTAPPRPPTAQPAGLTPDTLVLSVSQFPEDTDRNGYFDTAPVTVYLFDEPYQAPIAAAGAFTFTFVTHAGAPVATWTFDAQKTAEARRQFMPGPGYVFRLSLLEQGTDQLPPTQVLLRASFRPAGDGPVAQTRAATTVHLGRAR